MPVSRKDKASGLPGPHLFLRAPQAQAMPVGHTRSLSLTPQPLAAPSSSPVPGSLVLGRIPLSQLY